MTKGTTKRLSQIWKRSQERKKGRTTICQTKNFLRLTLQFGMKSDVNKFHQGKARRGGHCSTSPHSGEHPLSSNDLDHHHSNHLLLGQVVIQLWDTVRYGELRCDSGGEEGGEKEKEGGGTSTAYAMIAVWSFQSHQKMRESATQEREGIELTTTQLPDEAKLLRSILTVPTGAHKTVGTLTRSPSGPSAELWDEGHDREIRSGQCGNKVTALVKATDLEGT